MAARSANGKVLRLIRNARFNRPGSCSAVNLNSIIPTPISTTPDASIVQMIRDRIRLSSTAGYEPRCAELFCN